MLVGLSVFSEGVLHFLQIKKKFYIFYRNYLVALKELIDYKHGKRFFFPTVNNDTFLTLYQDKIIANYSFFYGAHYLIAGNPMFESYVSSEIYYVKFCYYYYLHYLYP